MKKFTLALAAALGLSLFGGAMTAEAAVSMQDARAIAVKQSGFSESDISILNLKNDTEDGRAVYEVTIYTHMMDEYEYDIDKESGQILKEKQEMGPGDHEAMSHMMMGGMMMHHMPPAPAQQGVPVKITLDEAKALALARVKGAEEHCIRIHPDKHHGHPTYEGEIFHNGYEYDFEIDAETGKFIEWEKEKSHAQLH